MNFAAIGASAMLAAAVIGGAPLFGAGTARAATIVQTFTFPGIVNTVETLDPIIVLPYLPPFAAESASLDPNAFNPALGTLESVKFDISAVEYFWYSLDHSTPGAPSFTFDEFNVHLYSSDALFLYHPSEPSDLIVSQWLSFGNSGDIEVVPLSGTIDSSGDLNYFIGPGTYSVNVDIQASTDLRSTLLSVAFSPATVTYTYIPAGAVPEPAAWAMMLVGVALTGIALRRRRERAPLAA